MQAILPRPDVAPLVKDGFVLLAGNLDEPEKEVGELLSKLENASMLPIVIVAEADGTFVTGKSGVTKPEQIIALLGA